MFSRKSLAERGLDAFGRRSWKAARRRFEELGHGRRAGEDYHLGLLYWRGLGGDRDAKAAAACFQRAAEQGHAAAQTAFALALRAGVGAPRDAAAAASLFRMAAAAGNCDAMVELAAMSGPEEAKRLLRRAAERGHPAAMRQLADKLMRDDPVGALALLYAEATMTGADEPRNRATKLAVEMKPAEITAAQRNGRALAEQAVKRLRGNA
jgi:TPR repeat protein